MDYNSSAEDYLNLVDEISEIDQIPDRIVPALLGFVKSLYKADMENKYSAPMVWIGMYIALASLVCILAMVADLLHGLHSRKLWFPCKFFRINSVFVVVIFVAMKLLLDLSGSMPGDVDQAGKLGSMAFMCTMMANLLPCLATTNSNELLLNITALSILVITLVVNVCIQIGTAIVVSYNQNIHILKYFAPTYDVESLHISKHIILATTYVALLLVLLILHVCSCLAILKSKEIIESKYQEGHKKASKEIQQLAGRSLTFDVLQKHVSNHWIMAGSGSPQFITASFHTTSASGVICAIITVLHTLKFTAIFTNGYGSDSNYSWSSMMVILIVQFIGVVIGTIAPLSRCLATLSFKVSSKVISNHFEILEVESYWTSKLYDWKQASIKLLFGSYSLKVVIQILKRLILRFCIEFQEGVVVVCKIIALIPFLFVCVLYCFRPLKAVFSCFGEKSNNSERNIDDLRPYVLQLDDEMELADRKLVGFSESVKGLIQKGEKNKPEDLIELIKNKSTKDFPGVEKFDQSEHHVPTNLLSQVKYQVCWSLPVVTLTTIAVSLQVDDEVKSLLKSVRKGLEYVRKVEECLNGTDDDYVSICKEAETLWNEVDVYHKWLGHDLQLGKAAAAGQIVKWFRDTSKKIGHEEESNGGGNGDSIHNSVCANSMYHITKAILRNNNHDNIESRKELFDNLSSMIANIIAACLTNIPQVIIVKCHTKEIDKREASVKEAALLLGETKGIMEILGEHHIPCMNPSDLPFISKWRAYRESQIP